MCFSLLQICVMCLVNKICCCGEQIKVWLYANGLSEEKGEKQSFRIGWRTVTPLSVKIDTKTYNVDFVIRYVRLFSIFRLKGFNFQHFPVSESNSDVFPFSVEQFPFAYSFSVDQCPLNGTTCNFLGSLSRILSEANWTFFLTGSRAVKPDVRYFIFMRLFWPLTWVKLGNLQTGFFYVVSRRFFLLFMVSSPFFWLQTFFMKLCYEENSTYQKYLFR